MTICQCKYTFICLSVWVGKIWLFFYRLKCNALSTTFCNIQLLIIDLTRDSSTCGKIFGTVRVFCQFLSPVQVTGFEHSISGLWDECSTIVSPEQSNWCQKYALLTFWRITICQCKFAFICLSVWVGKTWLFFYRLKCNALSSTFCNIQLLIIDVARDSSTRGQNFGFRWTL